MNKFKSLFSSKLALFLVFIASYFLMLSFKITPLICKMSKDGIAAVSFFNVCEVFPLDLFDIFLWIVLFLFLNIFANLFSKNIKTCCNAQCLSAYKVYLGLTCFLFLAWIPYFLTFYPGTLMQDEIFGIRWPYETSNQPLFYNYFLSFLWELGKFFGDELLGFAVFTILKMFLMGFAISYLLIFLFNRGINKYFLIVCYLLFAFLPIFPNYAICLIKDTSFSIFVLFMVLFLYENKNDFGKIFKEKKTFFMFLFLSLMIIWLRSNGLHIIVATVFVLGYLSKNYRKKFFALAVVLILAGTLPNHHRHVPFKETVGIPIQQIARTLNVNGEISKENKEIFNNVIEISLFKKYYDVFWVDAIKWKPEFNDGYLYKHKKEFLRAWVETFPKNFSTYLTAHVLATFDFWAVSPWRLDYNQTIFLHAVNLEDLYTDNINTGIAVNNEILSPDIAKKISEFMNANIFYLNAGTCGNLLLFFMTITILKGRRRNAVSALPIFFSWGTLLLAAPVAWSFRYVFYFALLMPFILSLPFMNEDEKEEKL